MRWALINGTTVVNVAEGGQAFADRVAPLFTAVIDVTAIACGAGWTWNGSTGSPVFTPPTETLAAAKTRRRGEIRSEGLARIQVRFPAISDFEVLKLVREQYLSIAVAARTPTTDMQWLIDTYAAVQTALVDVNNAATVAAVDAVTVNWPT